MSDFEQLMEAISVRKLVKVLELLSNGLDIKRKDSQGRTPLILAIIHEDERIVEVLLNAGADLEGRDYNGRTALLVAAYNMCCALSIVLLDEGAQVDPKDWAGYSPLIYAADNDHEELVAVLLKHNADVSIRNVQGNTALYYALEKRNPQIVEMLWLAGADPRGTRFESILDMDTATRPMENRESSGRNSCRRADDKDMELVRFMVLAKRSEDGCYRMTYGDAVSEVTHSLQKQIDRQNAHDFVDPGFVNCACASVDSEYGISIEKFDSVLRQLKAFYESPERCEVRHEFRKSFREALRVQAMLQRHFAKYLLHAAFERSSTEVNEEAAGEHGLFARNYAWDEEEVEDLLTEHGSADQFIDEENFIRVGLKIAFGERV